MQPPRDSLSKCNTDHLFTSIAPPIKPPPLEAVPQVLFTVDTIESEQEKLEQQLLISSQIQAPFFVKAGKATLLVAVYPAYIALYQVPKAVFTLVLPKVIQQLEKVSQATILRSWNLMVTLSVPILNAFTKTSKRVQNQFSKINLALTTLFAETAKAGTHKVSEGARKAVKAFSKLAPIFSQMAYQIATAANVMYSVVPKAAEIVKLNIQKVTEMATKIGQSIQQSIQPLFALAGVQFKAINMVYEAAKRIAESVEGPIKKAAKTLSKSVETVVNTTNQFVQPMIVWMASRIENVTIYIKERGEGVGKFCAKKFKQFAEKASRFYEAWIKILGRAVSPFWQLLQKLLKRFLEMIKRVPWEKLPEPALRAIDKLFKQINKFSKIVEVYLSTKRPNFAAKFAGFGNSFLSRGKLAPKKALDLTKTISKKLLKSFIAWLRILGRYGKVLLRELALEIRQWGEK